MTGERTTHLARAERIAGWLDTRFLDPVLGLVAPGAGDLVTAGFGLYLVRVAFALRLPPLVIARMLLNLGADMVLGAVPLVGDVFDFAFRANTRNLRLLRERHERGGAPRAADWLVVAGAALVFLAALAVPIVAVVWLIRRIAG